jgi:hypothetical protein
MCDTLNILGVFTNFRKVTTGFVVAPTRQI